MNGICHTPHVILVQITAEMKCFLLLLAFKLVTSNKLERNYLPPPGAKFAGGNFDNLQAPFEYPKENYPDSIDGLLHGTSPKKNTESGSNYIPDDGSYKTTVFNSDYITSTHPSDFGQANSVPTSLYTSTFPAPSSNTTFFDNFPSRSPNETNNFIGRGDNKENHENSSYFYYLPNLPEYGDDIAAIKYNTPYIGQNSRLDPYSNQVNNALSSGDAQSSPLKTADIKGKVQFDEPHTIGYYGGKPMIMMFQTNEPDRLTSKFGEFENKNISFDKDKSTSKSTPRPFQTPLVRTNSQKPKKSSVLNDDTDEPVYPKISVNPIETKNMTVRLDQRTNVPLRSRLRTKSNRPQTESERKATILNYDNLISSEGYSYAFDTSNGIHAEESGTAINGVKAKGSYSYTGDDGKVYTVTYTADENGFQPKGDHLPTSPPIPEAIKKVIEQAERDKAAGIFDDGSYDESKYGYQNYHGAMGRYHSKNKSRVPNIVQRVGSQVSKPVENRRNLAPNMRKATNKEVINTNINSENLKFSQKPITKSPLYHMLDQNNHGNLYSAPETKSDDNYGTNGQDYILTGLPVTDTNSFQQQVDNNNARLAPGTYDLNKNDSQLRNQNELFAPTVTRYNQNVIGDGLVTDYLNGQPNQVKYNQSNIVTSYDNGYFYVPPINEFHENEPFNQNKQPFAVTGTPHQEKYNTAVQRRTGLDNKLEKQSMSSIQSPEDLNTVINEMSATPHFISPIHHGSRYNDAQNESRKPDVYDRIFAINSNELDLSSYASTTTPMPEEIYLENQPNNGYFNHDYQTMTNAAVFEQTLPIFVDNGYNISTGGPGISISQNIVTSTFKPGTENNGINLEVNQNVKIYGIGGSKPTDDQGYPEKVFRNYDDGFYTGIIPGQEPRFSENYPDFHNGGHAQDFLNPTANPEKTNGNNLYPSESPVTRTDSAVAELFSNSDIEIQPQVNLFGVPVSSASSPNDFRGNGLTPDEELTTSGINTDQIPIKRVIGEDFSGPKQLQRFDLGTGYHYK